MARLFRHGRGAAVIVALSLGIAGCQPNNDSTCSAGSVAAVAADAKTSGVNYVALGSVQGAEYGVVQASSLASLWRAIDDGSPLAMFAPTSGGVILANGGAAARRIDASGSLLWTVGYGDVIGVNAALTTGAPAESLVVADAQSVRLLGPDGTVIWQEALPQTIASVSQVVADRDGGIWLTGTFTGSFAPWVAPVTSSTEQPSGPFLIHLDQDGVEIGSAAWNVPAIGFNQAVEGVDAAGAPMLVVSGELIDVAAPELGVPAAVGDALFAAGFGAGGQILWSHRLSAAVDLHADPDGALLALTETGGVVVVDRWDPTGVVVGGASFTVDSTKGDGLKWVVAPMAGGLVVAGEEIVPGTQGVDELCVGRHFLFQITTANLAIESLPSRLP